MKSLLAFDSKKKKNTPLHTVLRGQHGRSSIVSGIIRAMINDSTFDVAYKLVVEKKTPIGFVPMARKNK